MAQFEDWSHPIAVLVAWAQQHGDLELEFGEYVYVPKSLVDQRRLFRVRAKDLSVSWLDQKLSALAPGWEIALHSRVYRGECVSHIAMIDFVRFTRDTPEMLATVLSRRLVESLHVFASGRSHHGYSLDLLLPDAWIRFMGSLLLCNLPDAPPVVDHRWIGHRLIAGYGALRWSCNGGFYLQYPRLIGSVDILANEL